MSRLVTRPSARVLFAVGLLLTISFCGLYAWQDEESNPELADQMSVVRRSMRTLRRSIDKPEMNDKSLEATVAFQKAIQEAKPMEPIKAEKLEGAEKKKFIAAYRVDMIALQKQLLDMERHILEGDNKKARKIYDGLKALRDAAHKKYQ